MVDSNQINTLIPTRRNEKISLPKVQECAQLVRARWRRSSTEMSVRVDQLFVQRTGGRDYSDAIRRASARCHLTVRGDQDSQMPFGSQECAPGDDSYWGHRDENWIKRQRNGILGGDINGPRTTGACCCTQGAVRGFSVEADSDSQTIIKST